MQGGGGSRERFGLDGKVAVITGGSRGLGREMAVAFAEAGASVVVASRKGDACRALAEEIERTIGTDALGVAFHAGRWDDCDRLVDATVERFGKIDVLVNNAGMSPLYESVVGISEALYDKVLDVNLKGPFRLMALVGTRMAEQGGGAIVNVSSVAALGPSPIELPYGAAKAGLNALTIGMAGAFGPKVRVNCIMPGPFLTDISQAWSEPMLQAIERRTALQRAGQPHEIVGAALYFASDASSFTTGAILRIDGGARNG
jgi:NAD(P)-dependent dehydrogenase (short-subunit alcohol dehydrogenase family)